MPVPPTAAVGTADALERRLRSVYAKPFSDESAAEGRAEQMAAIDDHFTPAGGTSTAITLAQSRDWTTNGRPVPAAAVEALLNAVTARLTGDQGALELLIRNPVAALRINHPHPSSSTAAPPYTWWPPAALLLAACLRAVDRIITSGGAAGPALSVEEAERLRPLAVTNAFLVLSEPFRHPPESTAWWPHYHDPQQASSGPIGALFGETLLGENTWHIYIRETRKARADLLDALDGYQDRPEMAELGPHHIESLLALAAWRDDHDPGRPLVVPDATGGLNASPTVSDRQAVEHLAERHWLPRFAWWPVACGAFAGHLNGGNGRTAVTRGAAVLAVVLFAVQFFLYFTGRAVGAGCAGLAAYLAVGVSALSGGPLARYTWMLRLPAAAGVGALVLITLTASWWKNPTTGWVWAYLVLGAAAMAYLIIECLGHGVSPGRVYRAAGVWVAALIYSASITSIILVFVAPAFADSGAALQTLLDTPELVPRLQVWGTATAWCLAVGILSQIIWDDQAITAPLAHVTWRKGK